MKPIQRFWFNNKEKKLYISSTIPINADSEEAGTTETYTIDKNGFTLIEANGKKHHANMEDFLFEMVDYLLEDEE
ncbi:MAG: hypothetical protein WC998_08820 [Candidatus Paceibacterota bacterium]|jgi:hypothetical protein